MLTRRRHLPRPRRGFSLIEILVVIAIIGVLVAVSAGAMFRLRAAQVTSNTEGTLSKLHGLMMTRWSAVLRQAEVTVPSSLVDRCGGDKERAKALWTFATLKNEFPMTFNEAKATTTFGATLTPRGVFTKVANGTYTPALTAEEESAALFHAILSQTGNSGSVAGSDGSNQQVSNTSPDGKGATVYKDGWGSSVLFVRNATNGEISGPSYTKPTRIVLGGTNTDVKNMYDPRGLISVWPGPANPWLALFTLDPAGTTKNTDYMRQEFSKGLPATGPFAFKTITATENYLPTLVSFGANKKPGVDYLDPAADDSADNLLSYRLRREGDKGN